MVTKIEPYKGIAVIYDEIRPSYPEKLIGDIISKTNLKLSDSLLEIGAGTGKATLQFAERGFTIHAVELGEDMAQILKDKCSNYPKVTLDVAVFEEWNCPGDRKYDMIYCAQAFHWLDSRVKYKKCHSLLKDKGYLVLFWYKAIDDEQLETIEIERKINDIVSRYISNYSSDEGKPERRKHYELTEKDDRKAEIENSGLFELVERIDYTQETRNNASQYFKVKKSVPAFSSVLDGLDDRVVERMDKEIEEVINSHGGYVGTKFEFSLYIAKKLDNLF